MSREQMLSDSVVRTCIGRVGDRGQGPPSLWGQKDAFCSHDGHKHVQRPRCLGLTSIGEEAGVGAPFARAIDTTDALACGVNIR
jgi:hypothetical protein